MTRGYRPGGFYRIDDRSGFKIRADQTVKQWDDLIVRQNDAEVRHPQDFVRGQIDIQTVPDPRPEPTDIVLGDGAYFLVENDLWKGWRAYQEYVGGSNAVFKSFSGFDGEITTGDLG